MRLAFWRTLRKLDKEFVVSGECYYTQSYPIYNSLSIYWYIVCSILSKDSETFVENLRLAQTIYSMCFFVVGLTPAHTSSLLVVRDDIYFKGFFC